MFPVEFTSEVSQKEYLCPSGALAPLVGKGSVLSCSVSGLCVSGLEMALSHSSGSCLGRAHCTGKPTCGRHQHSQNRSGIYLIGQVVSLPVTPGAQQRIQSTCPRNGVFSQCFPRKSKAPHPQEIRKNQWLGFG